MNRPKHLPSGPDDPPALRRPLTEPLSPQTCAHVLLSEEDRRLYLSRFRRPNLENLQRQSASKAVNTLCRKVVHCPHCGATNGTVKKIGALKIVHEKYRAKKVASEHEEFLKTFGNAVREDAGLRQHVRKAQEDLNPLRVLELFKRISAEVGSALCTCAVC